MWNGLESDVHSTAHIVGDFLGSVVLFVSSYLLYSRRDRERDREKREQQRNDRVDARLHELETWKIRHEERERVLREQKRIREGGPS